MKKTLISVFIYLLLICYSVFADDNHYINLFVGDRASGLAGAYTAIADGPEGVFYNPAGLAFSGSQYFSLSVNAVQFKMLYYKNVYERTDGTPFDYMRYSLSFIPNFTGFIQKAKHFTFAFTISSPDSEFYDQRDNAEVYDDLQNNKISVPLNVNFNNKDQTYQVGPSIAFLVNKYFSIGMSAFIKYQDKKRINQTVRASFDKVIQNGEPTDIEYFETSSQYENHKILGLNFQVGVQVMPFDKLSIGYMAAVMFDIFDVQSIQTTKLLGLIENQTYISTKTLDVTNNTWKVYHLAENGFFRPMIIKQALGLCFFINKSMLVSLDGYLYIPVQSVDKHLNLVSYQYNRQTKKYDVSLGGDLYQSLNVIGNVACGFEWYITPNFPLRLGFFTNFTNSRDIKEGDKGKNDYINMFGGSISFGFSTSDMSINLGAVVQGGVGKAQIIDDSYDIQELVGVTANLFIASTYQF